MVSALFAAPDAWFAVRDSRAGMGYLPSKQKMQLSFSDALRSFTDLIGNTEGIQYTSRLIACTAQALSPILPTQAAVSTFEPVDNFIAACRFVLDFHYFTGSDFLKDVAKQAWLTVLTNISFTISDIAATLEYLDKAHLINTAKVAASLASVSIFGQQPLEILQRIAVARLCAATALIGYVLMAADCAYRAYRGDYTAITLNGLARGLLEVAHKVLIAVGGAFLTTAGGSAVVTVLGIAAAACAVNGVYQYQKQRRSV